MRGLPANEKQEVDLSHGKGVDPGVNLNSRTRIDLPAVVFTRPSQILYLCVYQTYQASGYQHRNEFNISQITRLLARVP